MKKMTIGFSPCPNDTFIFDALVNGLIDTEGFAFEPVLEDVQTLNNWALEGRLDISKLSYPAFFQASAIYDLLHAGSALGKGVGPLLISGKKYDYSEQDINKADIYLPGKNTTAHLLFSFAFPHAKQKIFKVFHEIEDAVLNNTNALGVIIHENRFTYQDKGLYKVMDLGNFWEEKMQVPIPLGGIVIRRSFGNEITDTINRLIRKSLEYSFRNYPEISEFVRMHAQAMSEDVMRKHIDLYVNNYSLELGDAGLKAINVLNNVYRQVQDSIDE